MPLIGMGLVHHAENVNVELTSQGVGLSKDCIFSSLEVLLLATPRSSVFLAQYPGAAIGPVDRSPIGRIPRRG